MICPNCGRELADGEICTCQQNNNENAQNVYSDVHQSEPVNENNYYNQNAEPNYGTYYNPNAQQQNSYYQQNPQQPYYAPVPEAAPARTDYPQGYKIKKKYVAVLLAASLGFIGIHNYYLGDSSKGLAKILLTTVGSLLFGLGPVAASIWALVETVQLLTEDIDKDANGFKIQTFEESLKKTFEENK